MYPDHKIAELRQAIHDFIAWEAAGFPINDPTDLYPDDRLAVCTRPQELIPLLERLEDAESEVLRLKELLSK